MRRKNWQGLLLNEMEGGSRKPWEPMVRIPVPMGESRDALSFVGIYCEAEGYAHEVRYPGDETAVVTVTYDGHDEYLGDCPMVRAEFALVLPDESSAADPETTDVLDALRGTLEARHD